MADELRETSLIEDVFAGLSKAGSATRQGIINVSRGYKEEGDFDRILSGEKIVTARDLISDLENRYGIDLTVGNADSDSMVDKTANFGVELLTDIFTSPDSLIAGPTKLLAKAGALNKIANPTARKMAERAITGATFGALTTQPDDDIIDTLQATAVGAATFGLGPEAVKFGARKVNSAGEFVLNSIIEKSNKKPFAVRELARKAGAKFLPKNFTEASDIFKTFKQDSKPMQRLAQDLQEDALIRFENTLDEVGIAGDDKIAKLNELRLNMAEGASNLIEKKQSNIELLNEIVLRRDDGTLRSITADDVVRLGISDPDTLDDMRKALLDGDIMNDVEINKIAALGANETSLNKMLDKLSSDPLMTKGVVDFVDVNTKLGDNYNRFIHNKLGLMIRRAKAMKSGPEKVELLEQIRMLDDQMFVPLAFHTLDLKTIDEASEAFLFKEATEGVGLRESSKFMKDIAGTSFRDEIITASNRYAFTFASASEKEAAKLLVDVVNGTKQKFLKTKGMSIPEILSSDKLDSSEKGLALLSVYDRFIDLMKTKHLATGSSWLVTNYIDNVLKTYAFAGSGPAIKSAVTIPVQGGGAILEAIDTKVLGGAVNALSFGSLKAFNDKGTFKKLMKGFDPTEVDSIQYNDGAVDIAGFFGAMDTNKFIDFKKATGEKGIETIKTGFIGGRAISEKVIDELAGATPEAFLGKTQDFFWNTVGAVGSATEGTARYTLFKDLAETALESSPVLSKRFKKEGEGFYRSMIDDLKNRNEIEFTALHKEDLSVKEFAKARDKLTEVIEAEKVFKEASRRTNSIFFDYDDVTAFEKHVMKRIFPYWTFFSRNFQQWLEHGFDANNIARTAKVIKPAQNLGRPLSQEERMKSPKWLLEKGARVTEDDNGNLSLAFQPNLSLFDAVNTVQDLSGSVLGKLSTPLKVAGEVATNREAFGRDIPVFPTEDKPKKRVLESGLTLLPDAILENLGVFRDENGKLFTNNRLSAGVLKASELAPIPQVSGQFARAKRDFIHKESSLVEASQNLIPAFRTFNLDKEQLERQGKFNKRAIEQFEGGKEELLGTKRKSKGRKRRRRGRRKRRK